jgi:hypothetical protein
MTKTMRIERPGRQRTTQSRTAMVTAAGKMVEACLRQYALGWIRLRSYIELKNLRFTGFRGTPHSDMSCGGGKGSGEMSVAATLPICNRAMDERFHAREPVEGARSVAEAKDTNHCAPGTGPNVVPLGGRRLLSIHVTAWISLTQFKDLPMEPLSVSFCPCDWRPRKSLTSTAAITNSSLGPKQQMTSIN